MTGRHRTRRRGTTVVAITALGAVAVAGGLLVQRRMSADPCPRRTALTVAATPEIAPQIRTAATAWSARDGVCADVTVTDRRPAEVAAAAAVEHRVTLTGLGLPADSAATLPDVWVPDSSSWLARLAALAPGFRPAVSGSLATSPVVLAMPAPSATQRRWSGTALTWRQVLDAVVGDDGLRVGTADPTQDVTGLAALSALSAAAATTSGAQTTTTAALRAVAANGATLREGLLAKLPQSPSQAAAPTALGAVALSEVDATRFNAGRPPVPLTTLDLRPAPPPLDFPFALMPGIDPAKSALAESLRAALREPSFTATTTAGGLRPPLAAGVSSLDLRAVDRMLATWTVVTGPARMLAVIDVSGSMLRTVPTAGNATRIRLTVQTARQGLALLDDTWSLGLWVFAARLDGGRDHRELVPIGPLSSRRPQLVSALDGIEAGNGVGTGLYDTVLNAYRAVQDDWKPGQANSVVLFTDGAGDTDPDGGLTEADLVKRLRQTADSRRPVQMVLIGIGDEVRQKELERIATATGSGSAFVAEDPARISEIFLQAVARRPIAPQ